MSYLNNAALRQAVPQREFVMSATLRTLQQYPFFSEASRSLKDRILAVAVPVSLSPGAYFFQKGETIANVGLVGAGSVRVYIIGDTGREVTLYHVGPGDTCPINLLCAILGRHALAHAYVESDLEAVIIPARAVRAWAAEESTVRQFVFEALAVRLIDVLARIEVIAFQRIDRRLAEYLLYRLELTVDDAETIRVTHEHIAFEIGSAREVVTRALKAFERSGAIELGRGFVVVRNARLLRNFCNDTDG